MNKYAMVVATVVCISFLGARSIAEESATKDVYVPQQQGLFDKVINTYSHFFGRSAPAGESIKIIEARASTGGESLKKESYLIKPGDTLVGISKKISVDRKILAEKNGLTRPYKIRTGRRLFYDESDIKMSTVAKRSKSTSGMKEGEKKISTIVQKKGASKKGRKLMTGSQENIRSENLPVRDVFRNFVCDQGRFQRILTQFGLNDLEKNELHKRIMDGDLRWGVARKGDRFDLGLNKEDIVLQNPEVNLLNQMTDLLAADVYRISSGKEIWIFLKGGNIYLYKRGNLQDELTSDPPPLKRTSVDKMVTELRERSLNSPELVKRSDNRCADEGTVLSEYESPKSYLENFSSRRKKPVVPSFNKSRMWPGGTAVAPARATPDDNADEIIIEPKFIKVESLDDGPVAPVDAANMVVDFSKKAPLAKKETKTWTGGVAVSPGRVKIE